MLGREVGKLAKYAVAPLIGMLVGKGWISAELAADLEGFVVVLVAALVTYGWSKINERRYRRDRRDHFEQSREMAYGDPGRDRVDEGPRDGGEA